MSQQPETFGATFHRHFGNNEIHRDGGAECTRSNPLPVYVFDPGYLDEHDAFIRKEAAEQIAQLQRRVQDLSRGQGQWHSNRLPIGL